MNPMDLVTENNQQKQIEELQARVAELESGVKEFCDNDAGYRAVMFQSDLEKLLNRTPTQSLNAIKAQALEELQKKMYENFTIGHDIYQEYQHCIDFVGDEAKQLREEV